MGTPKSHRGSFVVLLWAWGTISPQLLQHLMMLFLVDMDNAKVVNLDTARKIAGIGTSGNYAQNMNQQLVSLFPARNMPKPHSFLAPMKLH